MTRADATEPRYVRLVPHIQSRLGAVLRQQGRKDEAEASYRRTIDQLQALDRRTNAFFGDAFERAQAREALANLLLERDHPADARAVLEESIADLQTGRKGDPRMRPSSELLAEQYRNLAAVLQRLQEPELAAKASLQAEELTKRMRAWPSGGPSFRPRREREPSRPD